MGTELPIFKDARRQMRRPLLGDLSGRLYAAEGCRPIPCLAVDASMSGLRVLAHEELSPGAQMYLEFESHNIPLVMIWCQKDGNRLGSFAYGLMTTRKTDDLIKLFTNLGWLDNIDGTRAWLNKVKFINRFEE